MGLDIQKIAALAHIKLTDKEAVELGKDLEAVLQYVEKLQNVNTDQVAETSHVFELTDVMRPDEVKRTDVRDKVLEHAPAREGNFFKVPKVVER